MQLHYFDYGEHIVLIMRKQPPEVFYKKVLLRISLYLRENTWVGVSF